MWEGRLQSVALLVLASLALLAIAPFAPERQISRYDGHYVGRGSGTFPYSAGAQSLPFVLDISSGKVTMTQTCGKPPCVGSLGGNVFTIDAGFGCDLTGRITLSGLVATINGEWSCTGHPGGSGKWSAARTAGAPVARPEDESPRSDPSSGGGTPIGPGGQQPSEWGCNIPQQGTNCGGPPAKPPEPESIAQQIAFGSIGDKTLGDPDVPLWGNATSGLPVRYQASGGCLIDGYSLRFSAEGICTVIASQPGNDRFKPALDMTVSILVHPAKPQCPDPLGCMDFGGSLVPLTEEVPLIKAPDPSRAYFGIGGGSSLRWDPQTSTYVPVREGQELRDSEQFKIGPRSKASLSIFGRTVEVKSGAAAGSFNYAAIGDTEVAARMYESLLRRTDLSKARSMSLGTGTAVAVHGGGDTAPVVTSMSAGSSLSFYARAAADEAKGILTTTVQAGRDVLGYFTTTSSGTVSEIGIQRGKGRIIDNEDPQLRGILDKAGLRGSKPKVALPNAVAALRGTDLTVEVVEEAGITLTRIEVTSGLVTVSVPSTGSEYTLEAGEFVELTTRAPSTGTGSGLLAALGGGAAALAAATTFVLRRRRGRPDAHPLT